MNSHTYRSFLSLFLIILLGITYGGKDVHHLFHDHKVSENKCEAASDHHFHNGSFDFHCQLCQINGNEYKYQADITSASFGLATHDSRYKLVNLIDALAYESSVFLRGPPFSRSSS